MKYKGFTIVPDSIVTRYGAVGGVIFGKIARYCDWSPLDVCTASNKTLAKELKFGESTIRKYKKILEEDGVISLTGRTGDVNTVTIVNKMVMEIETSLPSSAPPATKKLPLVEVPPLPDSDKDIDTSENKADALAWQAGINLKGVATGFALQDYPVDVTDKLEVLLHYYPHLEVPQKPNTANWIKQIRTGWKNRSIKDLHAMCKYTKREGWGIAQPASINKAYASMLSAKQTTLEDKLVEDRFG